MFVVDQRCRGGSIVSEETLGRKTAAKERVRQSPNRADAEVLVISEGEKEQ